MTTTRERMAAEELSDQTIRAAERAEIAEIARRATVPTPAPAAPVAPVIYYDIKQRFMEALRACECDAYRVPYKLIEEARAKLSAEIIDYETYDIARHIDGVIIGCNSTWNTLCREMVVIHCDKRLAELKAIQAVEEKQKIADAVQAKAHSGRFKRK